MAATHFLFKNLISLKTRQFRYVFEFWRKICLSSIKIFKYLHQKSNWKLLDLTWIYGQKSMGLSQCGSLVRTFKGLFPGCYASLFSYLGIPLENLHIFFWKDEKPLSSPLGFFAGFNRRFGCVHALEVFARTLGIILKRTWRHKSWQNKHKRSIFCELS